MRALAIVMLGATLATAASGCVAGVPHCCLIVMPARYDVGVVQLPERRGVGTHLALGYSWASSRPSATTPFDIGLGYVIDLRPDATEMEKASSAGPGPLGSFWGGYLEIAARLGGTRRQRAFAGLRAELLTRADADRDFGYGITARASWELMRTGQGANWIGALGAGVFVELSTREFGGHLAEHVAVAGLSFRVPIAFKRVRR